MRLFYTAPSHSLVPNPFTTSEGVTFVLVAEVAGGVRVTWGTSQERAAWRIYRADRSTGSGFVLVAILPAAARSFTDLREATQNPYRAGHAHSWRVLAAL